MARPSLDKNAKFKALVARLKLPRPYVRGLLDTMWDVAHECGNPVMGTPEQVEAAAEWPGEPGVLFKALKDLRFIDRVDRNKWAIHDYLDHAPGYVDSRRRQEEERKIDKTCAVCGRLYRSKDRRSLYCTDACKQLAHRKRKENVTDCYGALRNSYVTLPTVTDPPAPAPAPAPALNTEIHFPATSAGGNAVNPEEPPPQPDPKKPRAKKDRRQGAHVPVMEFFQERWQARWGDNYEPDIADWTHAARILRAVNGNLEHARKMVQSYVACEDPFLERERHPLRMLKVNRWKGWSLLDKGERSDLSSNFQIDMTYDPQIADDLKRSIADADEQH